MVVALINPTLRLFSLPPATPLQVTQCLGVLGPHPWYMVVAAPSGSVASYPKTQDLVAFEIPPGVFVKMEQGTWHAGAHAGQLGGAGDRKGGTI